MAHFLLPWNFDIRAETWHISSCHGTLMQIMSICLFMGMKKIIRMSRNLLAGVFSFRNAKQTEGFWNYHAA
jgi:hypothetical protein